MTTRSSTPRPRDGSQGLTILGRPLMYQEGMLPEDFVLRLHLLRNATGLSWNRFAEALGVDPKQVLRWKRGTEPCGGAMLSIVGLAAQVPGGIDLIMGKGFLTSSRRS